MAISDKNYATFGWYMIFMSTFHFLEFFATLLTNPSNLSVDSFLLNHSYAYGIAAISSWLEYGVELWAFPNIKASSLSVVGVLLCLFGDGIRKAAMFNAGQSFNHIIQGTKRNDHELVTHGVFSIVRHPSYLGWFFWSVGTQVILCNPVCCVAYAIASWKFFADRIYVEEFMLLRMFGDDYANYQKKVPITGIPFIKGFIHKHSE